MSGPLPVDAPVPGPRAPEPVLLGHRIEREHPQGVPGLVRASAASVPDRPALLDQDRTLTYGELDRLSDALAERIAEATDGIEPHRPVAVCLPRGADLVVAALAVLKAGRPYLPTDPDEPAARLAAMADAARPAAVVCERDDTAAALGLAGRLAVPRTAPADQAVRPLPAVAPDTPVYVLFTSGSTGTPKGVVQHSAGLCNRLLWMRDAFPKSARRVLQKTPFTFDVSGWEIWLPLISGGLCVLAPPGAHRDPAEIARWIERHDITLCHFVPSMLREFLRRLPADACRSLEDVVCSGEALPAPVAAAALAALPARLHNLYGPTEAAIDVTAWTVPRGIGVADVVPIGTPIDNVDLYVVDADGRPVTEGEPGELWIGGVAVACGYAGRPERTAAAFVSLGGTRCYRTGDRVRVRGGLLEYLGRVDDQVKVRGVRIEPGEVERALESHPLVERAVVVAVRPADGEYDVLAALLTQTGETPVADGVLREHLASRLPLTFVPGLFVRSKDVPLGRSGKTDRHAVRRLVLDALGATDALDVPRASDGSAPAAGAADVEVDPLATVWAAVLGRQAGPGRGFLSAGGHSLGAARVLGVVEEQFGVRLPVTALLVDDMSLTGLRELLEDRIAVAPAPAPAADPDGAPMPAGLRRLHALNVLYPGAAAAHHVVKAVELLGPWDPGLLQPAVDSALARHDALRMGVRETPSGPWIHFADADADAVRCPVEFVAADDRYDAQEFARDSARRPIGSEAPMLRVRVLRGADRACLVLVLSHVVGDLRSADLLMDELLAGLAGESPAPSRQPGSYRAAAHAEGLLASGPRWRTALGHWRAALAGAPEEIDLPMRRERPALPDYGVEAHTRALSPELSERLRGASGSLGTTPAAFTLGCFSVLLHSWSGQKDLVVGVPVDFRRTPAEQVTVGMGMRTVAVRSVLGREDTLRDAVLRVRDVFLAGVDHADVPFDVVVESLGVRSRPGRNPVFQVWFNDLSSEASPRPVPGVRVRPVPLPAHSALFDLGLYVHRDGEATALTLAAAAALFDGDAVTTMADQLVRLIDLAVADLDVPCSGLNLATADGAPVPDADVAPHSPSEDASDLWARWEEQVRTAPEATALVVGDRSVRYAELAAQVELGVRGLRALGVGPGRRVLLRSARDELLPAALLAIWRLGAVAVLVPADAPEFQQQACRTAAETDLTLDLRSGGAEPSFAGLLAEAAARSGTASAPPSGTAPRWPRGEQLSHVLFTSGTTGVPAPVTVAARSLTDAVRHYLEAFDVRAADRFAVLSGPAHDPVLRDLLMPLCGGAAACVPPADLIRSPDRLFAWLRDTGITVLHATPSLLALIGAGAAAGGRLPALRLVVAGGELLTAERVHEIRSWTDAEIVNAYGTTETPQIAACATVAARGEQPSATASRLPVGRGVAGRQVYPADREGRPLAPGQRGEIVVRGDNLALAVGGAGDARLRPDPWGVAGTRIYRTGDEGYLTPQGETVVCGRLDRQLAVDGHRVEPEGIEALALRHPGVTGARAWLRHGPAGPVLALDVSTSGRTDSQALGEALKEHLRAHLPAHSVPAVITVGGAAGELDASHKSRGVAPAAPVRQPGRHARPLTEAARRYARVVSDLTAEVLGAPIPPDVSFFDAGLSSLTLLALHRELGNRLGTVPPVTALFAHPSVRALAAHLAELSPQGPEPEPPASRTSGVVMTAQPEGAPASGVAGAEDGGVPLREPVAVVGLAGRFPGAADLDEFWALLRDGGHGMSRVPKERLLELGVSEETVDDPDYVPVAPLFPEADCFDAELFGMTPREATVRDPQQRAFLETAHAALEHAGYDPFDVPVRTGVFGGASANRYLEHQLRHNPAAGRLDALTMDVSNNNDYVPLLVSYRLSLDGPSIAVATACSTSLVAVHLAAEALREGSCEMALAGAVEIEFPFGQGYTWTPGSIYARDGVCRPFDADAQGTVFGSGVGVVVLKLLSRALADGDTVHAVIRGSAVNNDGSDKVSFSAPSVSGQSRVVCSAMEAAGLRPEQIDYVEAHGTGTALGDPVEVAALAGAYAELAEGPLPRESVLIGSVKSNLGHLGPAAGVAGLIKTVLAMRHEQLPPSLHYRRPNPQIDFEATPFAVNDRLRAWPRDPARPRRAGVSSFGVGGTNAHLIVEEPPVSPPAPGAPDERPQLLVWSARDEVSLTTATGDLAADLSAPTAPGLADVAHTLRVGRAARPVRAALVAVSATEAVAALRSGDRRILRRAAAAPDGARRVCFAFPGQGSQSVRMGHGLYTALPAFAAAFDACLGLFAEDGLDLRPAWLGTDPAGVDHTSVAQPLLFAAEYATAQALIDAGVTPDVLVGHSVGELAAAAVAGVFNLADATRLVAVRGRLMGEMPVGSMLAVGCPAEDLPALPEGLTLAVVNAAGQCVVSGPGDIVARYAERLRSEGVQTQDLRTSHAFHSPSMAEAADRFEAELARVALKAPELPLVSAATGRPVSEQEAVQGAFWARQLVQPVRFDRAADLVLGQEPTLVLETGPGRALTGLLHRHPRVAAGSAAVLPTASTRRGEQEELRTFLGAVGGVFVEGHDLARPETGTGRRVPLHGYRYQRRRHWMDLPAVPAAPAEPHRPADDAATTATTAVAVPAVAPVAPSAEPNGDGTRPRAAGTPFATLSWTEAPLTPGTAVEPPPGASRRALVLLPAHPRAAAPVLSALHRTGFQVTRVRAGAEPSLGEEEFTVRPGEPGDLAAVLDELRRRDQAPHWLVHAWGLPEWEQPTTATVADQLDRGCLSLFGLVRSGTARPVDGALPQLLVLTSASADVSGAEPVHPVKAMAAGIVQTLRLEAPGLRCRVVDLGARPDERLLAAELGGEETAEVVAWRGARRWRRTEADLLPLPGRAEPLREQGVYVITGGLGGLGLEVAKGLARTGVFPRIALLGRRVPGDAALDADSEQRVLRAVREMEALGAEVLLQSCDVSDIEQLRAAWQRVVAELGPVNGVVQCAGLPGGGLVQLREPAEAAAVLRPKVLGALALQEVLATQPRPDFCVQFSSRAGAHGLVGSADYAAANAFLDAWSATPLAARMLSIGWPSWREVGMAARISAVPVDPMEAAEVAWDEELTADTHWMLAEHRISGRAVMPGTGHVDLVLRAWRRRGGRGPVRLGDVAFVRPLAVTGSRRVQVLLRPRADDAGYAFVVRSRGDGNDSWTEHTTGLIRALAEPRPTPALAARDASALSEPGPVRGGLVEFGARWDNVADLAVGPETDVVSLALPGEFAADLGEHVLHPALLDRATASLRRPADPPHLPLFYGRVDVFSDLPQRFEARIRRRVGEGTLVGDIELVADGAKVLAVVEGFTMRQVDPGSLAASLDGDTLGTAGHATVASRPLPGAVDERQGLAPRTGVDLFLQLLAQVTPPHVLVRPFVDGQPVSDLAPEPRTSAAPRPAVPQPAVPQAAVPEPVAAAQVKPEPEPEPEPTAGAGAGPVRATIRRLWEETLGQADFTDEDDYFELGGDSLAAVQLLARIREELGAELNVAVLFECPTVQLLAEAVLAQGGDR